MIIGVGSFQLDPTKRDAFIEGQLESMRSSRGEAGCLEYTFAPDPLEPDRVLLVEKWESQDALDAHLAAVRSRSPDAQASGSAITPKAASVVMYETGAETKLV